MKQKFNKSYKKSFLPECEKNALQTRANLQSAQTCKIGKIFKERRLLRSLSESEVAFQTCININYINAIESGSYSIFPARIFAVQYFRKYADFLGLKLEFFDIYNSL